MGIMKTLKLAGWDISVYEARPDGEVKGGLIVIHEVWGLADHIKDVANRLAAEGFIAWAPDLLTGTIDVSKASGLQQDLFNPEKRNEAQPKLRAIMAPLQNPDFAATTVKILKDLFNNLYETPDTNKNIGIIGFCFGGTYSFSLAVNEPRLKLALPFYGHSNFSVSELSKIKCPVRAFYGEKDEGLISGLDELKQNMKEAGVDFEATVYPNCGHAFFNDTNPYAYNAEAAKDAWNKVIGHLKKYL